MRRVLLLDAASSQTGAQPHLSVYGGVSVIGRVIPYKYRNMLEMLIKVMKLFDRNSSTNCLYITPLPIQNSHIIVKSGAMWRIVEPYARTPHLPIVEPYARTPHLPNRRSTKTAKACRRGRFWSTAWLLASRSGSWNVLPLTLSPRRRRCPGLVPHLGAWPR